MASPTNLTERLAQLRERKGGSPILRTQAPEDPPPSPSAGKRPTGGRKMATDYFLIVAYALLAVALTAQLGLILWLDIT